MSPKPHESDAGVIARARTAFDRNEWETGAAVLQELADGGEASAELWEDLWAARLKAGDLSAAIRAAEEAYRLYRRDGNDRRAAGLAIKLGFEYVASRGERVVGNGWFQRARRLLDGLDPGPEHAWFAIWEGHFAFLFDDRLDEGRDHLRRALELAKDAGATDVEFLALGLEGLTLVAQGSVTEGMNRLDEAVTAALGGEVSDLEAVGNASCYVMRACEAVRDFERAAEWYERVREYFDRWRIPRSLSYCRLHLAAILTWRGAWVQAENELLSLFAEMTSMAPGAVEAGRARLAEIRRRQGRFEEADGLLDSVEGTTAGLIGRAGLAFDRGEFGEAVNAVTRYFRRISPNDRMQRLPGLEILVPALCRLDRDADAKAAAAEIRSIAAAMNTNAAHALDAMAGGWIAERAGDLEQARCAFEDAIDLYGRARGAFEASRTRLDLGRVLLAEGLRDRARREIAAAVRDLETLGAAGDVARGRELLKALDRPESPELSPETAGADGLTARQIDVLRLVARGFSNREIGERLFLSPHTVKRHIADILTRLDLPTRAAAAVYAAQKGLTD